MVHTIKIKSVESDCSLPDNLPYIKVGVDVLRNGEFIESKSYGYPIETTKEDIVADLKKVSSSLDIDEEQKEKGLKLEESLKNVEVVKELIGEEL